jgi:hypothetical protein
MDLRVALDEPDVSEVLRRRLLPCDVQHRGGEVDAEDEALGGEPRGIARHLAVAAPDVEHAIARLDRRGAHERPVVRGDRSVEVLRVRGPVRTLLAVPCLQLRDVRRVNLHGAHRPHPTLLSR